MPMKSVQEVVQQKTREYIQEHAYDRLKQDLLSLQPVKPISEQTLSYFQTEINKTHAEKVKELQAKYWEEQQRADAEEATRDRSEAEEDVNNNAQIISEIQSLESKQRIHIGELELSRKEVEDAKARLQSLSERKENFQLRVTLSERCSRLVLKISSLGGEIENLRSPLEEAKLKQRHVAAEYEREQAVLGQLSTEIDSLEAQILRQLSTDQWSFLGRQTHERGKLHIYLQGVFNNGSLHVPHPVSLSSVYRSPLNPFMGQRSSLDRGSFPDLHAQALPMTIVHGPVTEVLRGPGFTLSHTFSTSYSFIDALKADAAVIRLLALGGTKDQQNTVEACRDASRRANNEVNDLEKKLNAKEVSLAEVKSDHELKTKQLAQLSAVTWLREDESQLLQAKGAVTLAEDLLEELKREGMQLTQKIQAQYTKRSQAILRRELHQVRAQARRARGEARERGDYIHQLSEQQNGYYRAALVPLERYTPNELEEIQQQVQKEASFAGFIDFMERDVSTLKGESEIQAIKTLCENVREQQRLSSHIESKRKLLTDKKQHLTSLTTIKQRHELAYQQSSQSKHAHLGKAQVELAALANKPAQDRYNRNIALIIGGVLTVIGAILGGVYLLGPASLTALGVIGISGGAILGAGLGLMLIAVITWVIVTNEREKSRVTLMQDISAKTSELESLKTASPELQRAKQLASEEVELMREIEEDQKSVLDDETSLSELIQVAYLIQPVASPKQSSELAPPPPAVASALEQFGVFAGDNRYSELLVNGQKASVGMGFRTN